MSGDDLSPEQVGALFPGLDPAITRAIVAGNQQQTGSQQQQQHVGHGGTDPAYISAMEAFEGLTHDDIYSDVQQMQPGVMQQLGDKWVAMAIEISGAATGLTMQTMSASADLEGAMADAAASAGKRFLTEIADVHEVISTVGHRVKAVAFGAEVVRKTVPAPVVGIPATATDSPLPPAIAVLADAATPGATSSTEQQKEELRLQAVAAMNSGYKPTFQPAGENVPTFVAPTVPGEGGDGTSSGANGTSGSTGNAGATGQSPGEQAENQNPADPTSTEDQTSAAATESAATESGDSTSDGSTSAQSTNNPSSTAPASAAPVSTTPGPTGTSPGSGTGGPSVGTPIGGVPGSGSLSAGAPVPGRSVAGLPLAGSAAQAAAGGAATGRGASPGMMAPPGARGGKREEDDEHLAPEYLRGVHRELLGDEAATVMPTLGANAAAAKTDSSSDS